MATKHPQPTIDQVTLRTPRVGALPIMPVRAHLRYLKQDGYCLSAGERALRRATLNRARTTMIGNAHLNRGTLSGLMDVGALPPEACAAVRRALPRFTRDPAYKLLKQQLDALEAPLYS